MKRRKTKSNAGTSVVALCAALLFGGCHATIHIHPWEEECNEKVVLTLHIDNDAPELGAIIDYTVEPPVIIYPGEIPEEASDSRKGTTRESSGNTLAEHPELETRARSLVNALEQIAPYRHDGDSWDIHLKYEVYACRAEEIRTRGILPIHTHDVFYRADERHPEHEVEMELPFGDITVVAVACLVPKGCGEDYFFLTDPLHTLVSDIGKRQGSHDNLYRDCFVTAEEFHTEPTGIDNHVQHLTATLERPQGRYIVIADDYEEYLRIANTELGLVTSRIYYPSYINIAYSLLTRLPVSSDFDFGFDSRPVLTYIDGAPYVRLGDDWSFVNGERSNFNIDISVSETAGNTLVSNNPGILVPLFNGKVTLVVGHWLTEIEESGGGVSVDPNFTDEIVVHF